MSQRKLKSWAAAVVLLGFFCQVAPAQDRHEIDESYEKAIATNPSTAGMMAAIHEAQTQWEREIEKKLKDFEKRLKPEEWKLIELTQKKWIAYRDSEVDAINKIFGNSGESAESKLESSMQIMKLFKARAQVLEGYSSVVSD
jgi:uncharacterized protein YecT (DUF1311 family)